MVQIQPQTCCIWPTSHWLLTLSQFDCLWQSELFSYIDPATVFFFFKKNFIGVWLLYKIPYVLCSITGTIHSLGL